MIILAKNLYLTKHSKYINITYYYIRDLQEYKQASVLYILTAEMAANRFSKLLSKKVF